ncbi:MAG: type IV pilin protein [Pseudomonadales bacterium]
MKVRQRGLTLIEMLVVIAIIALLSGIALPLYRDYLRTAAEGVLTHNIVTIEIFQEDIRLRTGRYATDLETVRALGWVPDSDRIRYAMTSDGGRYDVIAENDSGVSICLSFPGKQRCTE